MESQRVVALSVALVLLWFCGACSLKAQNSHSTTSAMELELAQVRDLVTADHLDSAIILSESLLSRLRQFGKTDTPLGLETQLNYGIALEHKGFDTSALHILFRTQKLSENNGQWETYAEASRALALLYEKLDRADQSIYQLRLAQSAIARHGPDSIYPRFAIRIASWHRMFGNRDSTLFYAREVLRTAPEFGQTYEEAEGHLLLGLTLKKYEEQLAHFTAAARLYRKAKNYTSLCGIFNNIAALHFGKDKFMEALAYTDSTFKTAPKAFARGSSGLLLLYSTYRLRGEIYQALQRPTAWHYIKHGYEMELAYVRAQNQEKLIAIDARYTDLEKSRQIKEQARQIESEKESRKWATVLLLIVLLFFVVLGYYYFQLRKANRKTRQQAEQLKSLDIAKSRFFANVSHELRTPLTLLLGPIQTLLKGDQLTDKQSHLLRKARQSGKQLEQLVNDILDLRKLEQGHLKPNPKPTGLPAFVGIYTAQFESLAEHKKIDFSVALPSENTPTILLDREKFRQILFNLLGNAFKFTPNGGRINVVVSLEASMLRLHVADTGPGIHPEDLPHLFDRYFQTSRPDKPAEGGTGIGLALCREYAHLFGGTIEVESTLGKGSVFRVAFPVSDVCDETPVSSTGVSGETGVSPHMPVSSTGVGGETGVSPHKPRQSTLLVVEDNLGLQDYIRSILQEKYRVVTADHGREALDLMMNGAATRENTFGKHPAFPDLILSDLMMPVMDGYQLLEKLKSDDTTRHIPVVMLTARAEAQDKLRALRIGVDDYLLKPFDEEELLVRIENLLKNSAARHSADAAEPETNSESLLLSQPDREWLETFEAYVRKHLSSGLLSVVELSHEFAMSESTLLRHLKRLTGLTPVQYLLEVRLAEARRLLEERICDSVAQVAARVGYDDARSFSRSFRQRFGKLPSEV